MYYAANFYKMSLTTATNCFSNFPVVSVFINFSFINFSYQTTKIKSQPILLLSEQLIRHNRNFKSFFYAYSFYYRQVLTQQKVSTFTIIFWSVRGCPQIYLQILSQFNLYCHRNHQNIYGFLMISKERRLINSFKFA